MSPEMAAPATLTESQSAFADALTNAEKPAPADVHRPVPGSDQTRRFDVYRNTVAVATREALAAAFPAVRALVGEEFFAAVAKVYIAETPPRSPLLFTYGGTFADFLDGFPPAASVPYLGDVARLEWARLSAYHAADADPVDISVLGAIPADDVAGATFRFHPSVALLRSRFPVVSLWAATGTDNAVDMRTAEDALTVRPALDVDTRILPPGGGAFIGALISGQTLGAAAEIAAEARQDFDLSSHLAGLFQTGAIIAVDVPAQPQEQAP